jgi:FkbM family methyltransferase
MGLHSVNFSGISGRSLGGRLLRLPLCLVPPGLVVPIVQGSLRGKRWIVGSSNHGCWLGSYEFEKQRLFAQTVQPGSIVFDIGAHAGFYTLLASELVGEKGQVCAFEPAPGNLGHLTRHIQMNQCHNVRLFAMAVGGRSEVAPFEAGLDSSTGHLAASPGRLVVAVVTLDDLLARGDVPVPDCVKLDVEGAEFEVLRGARSMLSEHHPVLFLATHGLEVHERCCGFLVDLGYRLRPIVGDDVKQTDELLATVWLE